MLEVPHYSKMLANIYQTTQCHIPDGSNLCSNHSENLSHCEGVSRSLSDKWKCTQLYDEYQN